MSKRNKEIRDNIAENDVTVMRSYLEVDVAEWLSENEIPFAYEGFVIPSVVGPGMDRWSEMVEAIQSIGEGERGEVRLPNGDTKDAFEILSMWNEIYEKHGLMNETISIPPRESLANFGKRMLLPDFALYLDADTTRGGEDFDWGDYDYIIEVSGLYGVGLPDEAEEDEWWDWYRVSAVAFKELAYNLLGLWDKVYWVIPNQPYIEGVSDGIPKSLRTDSKFTIMNTTQSGVELNDLAAEIGITAEKSDSGLSPAITPTEYKRPNDTTTEYTRGRVTPVQYEFDGYNRDNVVGDQDTVIADDGFIIYFGELGEVYIQDDRVHVRESQWRGQNMILLREYILNSLSELQDKDIIEGLRKR